MKTLLYTRLFTLAAALVCVSNALAADGTWTGGGTSGNWTDSGNWVGGTVPGASNALGTNTDTATFSGNTTTNVTVDTSRSIRNILFDGTSTGAFNLQTGNLYMNNGGAVTVNGNVFNAQTISSVSNLLTNAASYTFSNNSLNSGVLLNLGAIVSADSGNATLSGVGDGVVSGSITNTAGALGLVKSGSGTWTLKGNNTFNGTTTVNGGRLVIDYGDASGNPANYGVRSTSIISVGGSTVEFLAKSGAVTTQTVASVTSLVNTGLATFKISQNSATSANVTVTDITRTGGTVLLFDVSDGGQFFTAETNQATNRYLSGTASSFPVVLIRNSNGVDFARRNGSTTAIEAVADSGLIVNLTSGSTSTENYRLTDGLVISGTTGSTASSLRVTTSQANQSLNLGINTLLSGHLLFVGNNDYSIQGTGTMYGAGGGDGFIISNFGAGKLTLENGVKFGRNAGATGVYGTGLVDLASASNVTGVNQYFTTVRISQTGALNLSNGGTGNGRGGVYLGNGAILELNVATNLTRDVASAPTNGQIGWVGDGGFSAFGSERTVNLSSGGGLTWGSGGFVADGSTFILGSAYSNANLLFKNAIDLGSSNRVIKVNNGIVNGDVDGTLEGTLSGTGGMLSKTGNGTLSVLGNNTYTGGTAVYSGTLLVNNTSGSGTGSGDVFVASGARLGGNGTISGAVNVSGTIAAGNSIGILNSGNLSITSSGALDVELGRDGITPVSDLVNVTGTVSLQSGADLKLTLYSGLTNPELGDIFYLISNDDSDAISGVFTKLNGVNTTLNHGSVFTWNSQSWEISYEANFNSGFSGGNDLAIMAVVPEPSTWALLAASLTTVMILRRRRR